ncbi:cytochrome P450 [Streptomyces albiaxialis]|uniref:Cytochrome P450 n=1 Tax=Streptomyces albiaxialis TaxID=329523 RepID=A0ABP5ITT1_9ACTN
MSPRQAARQGQRSAAREEAAAVVRWGISQGLPRAAVRFAALRGDEVAKLLLDPARPDARALYDGLRRRGPVALPGAFGAVLGHAAANAVLRSDSFGVGNSELPTAVRRLYARATRGRVPGPTEPPSMLVTDPPLHTRYRKSVSKAFTPRHVAVLEERMTATAARLLDELGTASRFDLVDRYASRLPVAVIGDLLGVPPEERQRLLRWGDSAALLIDPGLTWRQYREADRALAAFADWFLGHLRRLRRDPGDDLLSRLTVLEGDDALDERELLSVGMLVLGAGFETTVSLISNAVALLDRHPEQLSKVQGDPGLWAGTVDEVLRLDSPVQFTMRVAYEDSVIEGVEIGEGQFLVMMLAAANRDPAVFDDPHTFDVTRPNAADHIAFSSGIHYCLGAGLARLEGRVALRMLYERFPGLRVSGPSRRRRTRALRGFARLPVTVPKSPARQFVTEAE